MTTKPPLIVTLLVALAVSACATGAAPSSPEPSPAAPATGEPSLALRASGLKFDPDELHVRANAAVTLRLDNADRDMHNFELRDEAGHKVFVGELFSGPAVRHESLPALAPGRYAFVCTAHPYMKGTLTAD
jgi:plastocyanin